LLRKAEEVRLEKGPDKIEALLEDVEMLASRDNTILEEVSFNPLLSLLYLLTGYASWN